MKREDILDADCEILFVRSTLQVNEELLAGTRVRFVATATSGSDHIDKNYLKSRGITFADSLGANSNSVAEYITYEILKSCLMRGKNPQGRILGIVGFGNIGSKVAFYAHKLGMKILVNDPPKYDDNYTFPDYCTYYENLDKIMKASDVFTTHVPMIKSGKYKTLNLFNSDNLKNLKPSALVLHASRGGVIEEKAFLDILHKNPGMETAIDVWAGEPSVNEELAARAISATPHIAGHSINGKIGGTLAVLKAYEEFSGKRFDHSPALQHITPSDFDGNFDDYAKIFDKISAARRFEEDDQEFLNLFACETEEERRKEFDRQRREYPVRNEYLKISDK